MTDQQFAETTQDESTTDQQAVATVPRQSVDETLSVSDRLTRNVKEQIGPARYFARNDDGEPVENWADVFDRVATNVAQAEALTDPDATENQVEYWTQQFRSAMNELRFVPNSPTLMNAGEPLQQLSACIAGDAPVYTRDGLTRMDQIEPGDEVLTHTGSFQPVTAHWSNGVKETVGLHRGTAQTEHYDAIMTPDHEVRNQDGEWVRADSVSDPVQPTLDPDVQFPDVLDLTQYTAVMAKDKPVVSVDGTVQVENSDDPRTADYDQQYNQVTSHVVNDNTMGWLIGLYLAEGDVDGSDLRFTIGQHEGDLRDRLTSALENVFETHVAVSESSAGQWQTISVSSPFVADLFETVVGTGGQVKRIPEWVFAGDDEYQESVLDGLLAGDGHSKPTGWKLTLANPTLAYEASLIARNLGRDVNFSLHAENELSANRTSRTYISHADTDETKLQNVAREQSEPVEVYDMEVAGDHSFVVGDFVVHNCFVRNPKDSMDDINQAQSDAAAIFKSGGGVGYAFHHLRPKGARVESTGGVSSGPLSFMELYDTTCGTVKQGGKRRGAQMAIMHAHHPDIGRFAVSKRGEDSYTNFNISYGLTDDLRDAVEADETITMYDPRTRPSSDHDLRAGEAFAVVPETAHFYDPQFEDAWNEQFDKPGLGLDGKPVEENFWRDYADQMATDFSEWRDQIDLEVGEPLELPAGFLWQLLVDGAWNNGEPGMFHIDEVNREHSFDPEVHPDQRIHASNPCSEQPLNEYEACNLGHVNLSLMVDDTAPMFDEFVERYSDDPIELVDSYLNRAIDHDTFTETVRTGTRFLDNVVTMSDFPIEEIEQEVGRKRKIGLGLMGFHQMLIQMGVEYGTDVSYEFAREIMRRIDQGATQMSHELAEQRGVFPAYEQSKWANPTEYPEWFETHAHRDPDDHEGGFPVRNHNMTTIAPTGTTSMIGNTTGGCEPLYQVAFFKNVGDDIQGDEMLVEFDDFFLQTLDENGIDTEQVKQETKELMLNNEFDEPADIPSVPDSVGELFVTTQDLVGEQHIRMQAAFQDYCDSGISKTLNMPNDATVAEVSEAFKLAMDVGIKGTTVYRDGSRNEQVKTTRVDNNLDDELSDEQLLAEVVERFTEGVETKPSAIDIDAEVTVQNIADELTVEGVDIGRTE